MTKYALSTVKLASKTPTLKPTKAPGYRVPAATQYQTKPTTAPSTSKGTGIVKQDDPICNVTVTCGSLNVRSGAGVDYDRIGGVSKGKVLNVYEVKDGWLKIGFGTGFGWVCAKYTTYKEQAPTTDPGTTEPDPQPGNTDPDPGTNPGNTDPGNTEPGNTDPGPEQKDDPSVTVDPSEVGDTGQDYGTLRKGSKGKGVEVLQRYLNKYLAHYSHLKPMTVDGDFGSQTFIRLGYYQYSRNIQGSGGIDVDCICGPNTWKTLRASAKEVYNITEPKNFSGLQCQGSYTGVQLKGGGTMRADAAAAYNEMYDAAKAAGHTLNTNSTYRGMTNAETVVGSNNGGTEGQIELFDYWNSNTTYCAKPGRSNHQTGIAADIAGSDGSSAKYKWLTNNASKYGFKRYVNEYWHWDYIGK